MPIMIDLETLAVTPDAVMLSIGACEFSYTNDTVLNSFYRRITPTGQEYGRIDPRTLAWHMLLPDDARREMVKCLTEGMHIKQALSDFADWMAHTKSDHGPTPLHVWSHGATFDTPITIFHLSRNGFDPDAVFGSHRIFRDTRTLYDVVGFKEVPSGDDYLAYMLAKGGTWSKRMGKQEGIEHHALSDAIFQARCVSSVYQGRRGVYLTNKREETAG